MDQRRVKTAPESINLYEMVEAFVADRMAVAESKEVTMTFDAGGGVEDSPRPLQADRYLVERVLSILTTNALNYTPAGGHVTVTVESRTSGDREWSGFSVSDTGPGIPKEEQAQLFTRFFRGQAASTSGVSGAGLGLAIAKEIVDLHEGEIEVESEGVPGKGATFRAWFPVTDATIA
jgi:signal transduction histidine kinase